MRPEGLGQFKKSTPSGLEPATFTLCKRWSACIERNEDYVEK
jgi:hypothetical protein